MHLQAMAMEKVGFEKGTPKYFIRDFNPSDPAAQPMSRASADVDLVSIAAPRFVLGGMLIGAGGFALAMSLLRLLPGAAVLVCAVLAVLVGMILLFNARN